MNYKGTVDSNGYLNGYCEIEFDNGDVYKGNISRNMKDGYGELFFRNGDKYYGNFINDEMTGKGTFITSEYRYEGDVLRGKFNGQGKLTTSKFTYSGQFDNDKRDGYGEYNEGQLRYVGFFKNNKFHGEGTLIDYDGEYRGTFYEGKFHGRGKLIFRNRDVYEGNWNNGKPHGSFKINASDYVFEGNMSNGKKEGYGIIKYSNGEVEEGEFSADRLVKSYREKTFKETSSNTTSSTNTKGFSSYASSTNVNVDIDYSKIDKSSKFANDDINLEEKIQRAFKSFANRNSKIFMDFLTEAREENEDYTNYLSRTLNYCQVTKPNFKYRGEHCGRDCWHGFGYLMNNDIVYNGEFNFGMKEGVGVYTIGKNTTIRGNFKLDKLEGYAVTYLNDNEYYKAYYKDGNLIGDYIEYYKNKVLYYRGSASGKYDNLSFINGELFEGSRVFKGTFINNLKSKGELYINNIKYVGNYVKGLLDGEVDKYENGVCKKVLFKNGKELYALDDLVEIRRDNYCYKGVLLNDKRHGYGECKYDDGGYYLGFWKEDCWDGEGFIKYNNGDEYTGTFNMYKREGQGECKYNDGGYYKGSWKEDCWHGEGFIKYNNGDEYTGTFNMYKKEGQGEYKYKEGGYYKGNWKEDYWHGEGFIKYNNGDEYLGTFNMGKKDGRGEYKYKDGNYYKGNWKEDYWHGEGFIKYNNGDEYLGTFNMGKKEGQGECKYKDGGYYKGSWKEDCWHGQGYVLYPDKSSYKGMFEWFKFKGFGEYVSPQGDKTIGDFLDSQFHGEMRTYNKNNKLVSEGSYNLGKKHGLVKEYSNQEKIYNLKYIGYYYENGEAKYIAEYVTNNAKVIGKFDLKTFTGFGEQYLEDKIFYRGEFYYGTETGRGIMFIHPDNKNEIIYDGDYFNGLRYGTIICNENNNVTKLTYKNNNPSSKRESASLPSKDILLSQDRSSYEWNNSEASKNFYSNKFKLGCMYLDGINCVKNQNIAFKYFKDSADYYPPSMIKLAICYLFGYGTAIDEKHAFKILSKHDDITVGNHESLYYLAYCYEFGKGTKIDYDKAAFYYCLAETSNFIRLSTTNEYYRCKEKKKSL